MRRIITILVACLLSFNAYAETLEGRVVSITDGDTFTLLTAEKKQVKIRLAEIDGPEPGQPYSSKSKDALGNLIFRADVRIEVQDIDRYGRTIGRVYRDGLDINAELVRQGAVWVYVEYAKDKRLFELEKGARANQRGLWAMPDPIPPWEWRKGERERRTRTKPSGECKIKGNISSKGECIFHVPGSRWYDQTKINKPGEKWFCTVEEAIAAGCRAPRL